jgi:hypothetical protein
MSSSDLIRWSAIGAMPAGIVWIVPGLLAVASQGEHAPGILVDYLVEGTFVLGVLLTAVGLHALQKGRYVRISDGRGFTRSSFASAAQVLGTMVRLLGSTALEFLVFPVRVLGVARRARALWCRHPASEGVVAPVWGGAHRWPTRCDSLGLSGETCCSFFGWRRATYSCNGASLPSSPHAWARHARGGSGLGTEIRWDVEATFGRIRVNCSA